VGSSALGRLQPFSKAYFSGKIELRLNNSEGWLTANSSRSSELDFAANGAELIATIGQKSELGMPSEMLEEMV